MTPADVSREARTWLGVPFHWQGRTLAGLDCGGLPAMVGEALGALLQPLEAPRYRPPLPTRYLLGEMRRYFVERPHARAQGCAGASVNCCEDCRTQLAGTVVLIGPQAQHCGIVTDAGTLISVQQSAGCREVTFTPAMLRLTRYVFEFPGVEYARG